ncbi:alpha/beta hydrolase [Kitasatospora sp. NPDC048540]|uniref:alpha/beta fold hydrolase n=1 Tax=unclassified Kitasatospora TaxID=2633591 RepID=UPI00053985C9|nr:alpha/beta hydrolase [Kitasatospora sp. MBT63]
MPTFTAPDGTTLAYRRVGRGEPLICLPGGAMRAAAYLGDLGGLAAHRTLILLDLRGTGRSGVPADPAGYRCDRQVADVEALRAHLGPDRIDLLAHSAGASLATRYAAEHPERIGRLALITPSGAALGIPFGDADYRAAARLRGERPWLPAALAALDAVLAGTATPEQRTDLLPLLYGRWDETARAHAAAEAGQRNAEAAEAYRAEGAFDPAGTRAALAGLKAPVLVLAGELDGGPTPARAAEFAEAFPLAVHRVQAGAGHYPWLDDADAFVRTVTDFLAP